MDRLLGFARIFPVGAAALALAAPPALAGGDCGADGRIFARVDLLARLDTNAVSEDFESFLVPVGGAMPLDVLCLDDATVANGQGPGLVEPGARYCGPAGSRLVWNDDHYFQLTTKTMLVDDAGEITITYSQPVTAMGIDVTAFVGYPFSATATIYDTVGNVVGTVSFALMAVGSDRVFVGWANSAGIGRVDISSAAYAWSPIIDDHAYGTCNGIGSSYCTANASSLGSPANLFATGSASATAGDLAFVSAPVPDQRGVFFHGAGQAQNPFGNGFLCTTGGIQRGAVVVASGNVAAYAFDNSDELHSLRAFVGTTRNFQYWFRDSQGGGAFFSTSNALSLAITP